MSSTADTAKLGIVVVNYGSHALLARNLAQLAVAEPHAVVVVDNFSTTTERASITDLATANGWDLLAMQDNVGFGAAMNRGVDRAIKLGCSVFLLVNPDVSLGTQTVSALVDHCVREPMTLVTPLVLMPDGTVWFRGGSLDLDTGETRSRVELPDGSTSGRIRPWLTGACLAAHADLWSAMGGFDDDYFLYWEDVDLSYRCLDAGGRLVVRDDLHCVHSVGGTQAHDDTGGTPSGRPKSNVYYFYNCRNRLLFAAKHLSRRNILRWLLSSPAYAKSVVLRGGKRQLVHSPMPALAAVRGLASGSVAAIGALLRPRQPKRRGELAHRNVRIYQTVRTAHLEAARDMVPATILYATTRYDFDASYAVGLDVQQASPARLARLLWRAPLDTVEINEPLMRQSHKRTLVAVTTLRVRNLLRRRPVHVVTYAIENLDYAYENLQGWRRTQRLLVDRVMSRLIAGAVDRIAFGTKDSLELYRRRTPQLFERAQTQLIWALPAPCDCAPEDRDPDLVVFLGALDHRKGFAELKDAWPGVVQRVPSATLEVLGKGALEDAAHEFAAVGPNVTFVHDPQRGVIHRTLRRASVLVLLSQPSPTWREQIGRPLLEALQHGCAVLATTETSIAPWLAEHGHRVVAPTADADEVADAITQLLQSARTAESVIADLPAIDGRIAADSWLFDWAG